MFDSAPFLKITLFKLSAPFAFEVQARVSECCVNFLADLCAINFLALAHSHALFGPHLHPAFRISLKDLSILWWQGKVSLARIIERWNAVRCNHPMGLGSLLAMRLGTN